MLPGVLEIALQYCVVTASNDRGFHDRDAGATDDYPSGRWGVIHRRARSMIAAVPETVRPGSIRRSRAGAALVDRVLAARPSTLIRSLRSAARRFRIAPGRRLGIGFLLVDGFHFGGRFLVERHD